MLNSIEAKYGIKYIKYNVYIYIYIYIYMNRSIMN